MEKKLPLIDLHEDIAVYYMEHGGGLPLADYRDDLDGRQADIPKYERANVRLVFSSIFPGIGTFDARNGSWRQGLVFRAAFDIAMEQIRIYHRMAETYGIEIIEEAGQAKEIISSSRWRLGFIMHLEGADSLVDPYDLKIFYKLGLRSIGLTWNYNNRYASSCMSRKDYGLTPEGEELVSLANKLGVIVDLAHAGMRTALEAIELSKKPVMISHANVRRLCDVPRNVTDEVLEALHRNNGVIGITMVPTFISKDKHPGMDDLLKHILYIYENYGADMIAIGTDYHGLLGLKPPEGLESIDKLPTLLEKLAEKGLGDADLENIAYRNALRVIEANLGG